MATSITSTTAGLAVSEAAEQITLASMSNVTVGGKLFVDGEMMSVKSVSAASGAGVAYVRRGQEGSRRRAHANGVTVWPGLAGAFSKSVPSGVGSAAAELYLPRLVVGATPDHLGRIFTLGGVSGTTWIEIPLEFTGDRRRLRNIRTRTLTADVNLGATIMAAMVGFGYRLVDAYAIANGGAAATVTSVDILGTLSSSRKLVAFLVAGLTENTLLRAGAATNGVILAAGASFTKNDNNTAVTIGKTGSDLATATSIDTSIDFVIE